MTETNKFVTGFAVGAVVVAIIAFVVAPSVPNQDKDDLANVAAVVGDGNDPAEAVDEKVDVSEEGHFRGNSDASIVIVEFSDYQCPYCSKFHNTMNDLMAIYPSIKWVYKHFPLDSIHPYARKAAEASECAGDQNKFWEYNDELFDRQTEIKPDFFGELAKELKLDTAKFNKCLSSNKYADKVEADYQEGVKAGVRGTPGGFLNGSPLGGAVPLQQMKSKIDALLK